MLLIDQWGYAIPLGGSNYANCLYWPILFEHEMLSISAVPEVFGGDTFYLERFLYSTFYIHDATINEGKLLFRTYVDIGNPATRCIVIGY